MNQLSYGIYRRPWCFRESVHPRIAEEIGNHGSLNRKCAVHLLLQDESGASLMMYVMHGMQSSFYCLARLHQSHAGYCSGGRWHSSDFAFPHAQQLEYCCSDIQAVYSLSCLQVKREGLRNLKLYDRF